MAVVRKSSAALGEQVPIGPPLLEARDGFGQVAGGTRPEGRPLHVGGGTDEVRGNSSVPLRKILTPPPDRST